MGEANGSRAQRAGVIHRLALPLGVIVLGGIAVWMGLQVLEVARPVLAPVVMAVLLTGLLMPVQILLNHRLRLPRYLAATVTVLATLAALTGLVWASGAELAQGVTEIRETAALEISDVKDWVVSSPLPVDREDVSAAFDTASSWVRENTSGLAQGAIGAGLSVGSALMSALLALFITLFLLAQGDRITSWMICLLPRRHQDRTYQAARRGWVTLGTYAKVQLLIAGIDAIGIGVGAWALGLPLVLPMTALTFLLCVIPIIGAVASGALVVLVALAFKGTTTALIMLAIVIVVQQLESDVLAPVLLGTAVNLHPLTVLLTVSAGWYLVGFLGALFAVPLVATANTMARYVTGRDPFPALDTGGSALTDSPRRLARGVETTQVPKRLGSATPAWLRSSRRGQSLAAARVRRDGAQVEPD